MRGGRCWVIAGFVLLGACGGGDDAADPERPATTSTTAAAGSGGGAGGGGGVEQPGAASPEVDWLDGELSVDIGDGHTLRHCPGDAPVLCIERDGADVGIVELSSFPITSLEAVQRALANGPRPALEAHVAEYVASLRDDRVAGCGAGYTVTPLPTTFIDGEDGPVVSYGFTGARRGEAVSERTVQWAAIRGDHLVLLNLSGYDDGACVPAEGEGSVADAVAVEPLLRPVVAANPLPNEVGAGA